jgi:alkylhydroperoxidase family enzyme
MMVHGAVLRKNGLSAQEVIAILEDNHQAGLTPLEEHMMDYAAKTCSNPPTVTQADVDRLRADGLDDQQITDIALAAVARNFISRFFEALGASSDSELQQQEPELWDYLKDWGKRS